MAESKPNPLRIQEIILKNQLSSTSVSRNSLVDLMQAMLAVPPGAKVSVPQFNKSRAAIKGLIRSVENVSTMIADDLEEQLVLATAPEFYDGTKSEEEIQERNSEIAGASIALITSLQTLGGHYLKAVEHLLNMNPNEGGKMFCEAVAQVRSIISPQAVEPVEK